MTALDFKYHNWALFLGFVFLAFAFHTYNLGYASYDLDEAAHIWHAQKPYTEVVAQASHDPNPPVYNLMLSSWVKTFGVSEFATRFLSVLFGALGVGLMLLIGSRNFGLAVGIMAALFYCFSPIQFRFTHLARPYSILMVTVILSYGGLFEVLKNPSKRRLFLYYLATTAMIYVHPTSVFNLAAQGIIILGFYLKDWKSNIRAFTPMVLAFLSFGAWVIAIPYFERDDRMWFDAPRWSDIQYVLEVFYGGIILLITQLVVLLLSFVLIVLRKENRELKRYSWLIIWSFVPFILSIGFSHFLKPVFQDKYILSVQPAMMFLLAYSIYQLRFRLLQWACFVMVMGFLVSSADVTLNPEGDWRKAIAFLKEEQTKSNSAILLNPWYEFRTFSYYYDRPGYEIPDSSFKKLVEKDVFTSWHDVYDTLNLEPKFDVFHSVVAHEGFNSSNVNEQILDTSATLIDVQRFIGISIETHAFHRKVLPNDEYSESKTLSFEKFKPESSMNLCVDVDLVKYQNLDGVLLITSIETDSGESILYNSKPIDTYTDRKKPLHIQEVINLSGVDEEWVLKTYLRNTQQRSFEYSNLRIVTN